jgi:tetratricopeptide (TPR) repeat protein/tRNA A-37 threonylcarbamoyl transferase component Bud32
MSASKARAIFVELVDQVPPEQWDERLAVLAGEDVALRDRVAALLAAHRQADSFLEHPAAPVVWGETADVPGPALTILDGNAAEGEPTATAGAVLAGRYTLLEALGEGGMGAVWLAQQTDPVKRRVAVKLIKPGMDSKQVLARFEAERQALALMDHPNIARVLDAGATALGRPYFVMELVQGVPITDFCDEHQLTPRQRLELFIPICQAIQHAHQKGVIHRDIKPSNVLVAVQDGRPVPKVIDFGIAKAAGLALTDRTLQTGLGTIVGTLEYMSPEQAELNQLDIDTRSDIYSLGVLLYELLAGSPPFLRKDLERAGMLEMLRVIREQEPSRPSTKLSSSDRLPGLAANRGTEPAKLTRLVRGELDWIVMKALEKDRSRRYESATGFAADVQRYLIDEPVQACPPSALYRWGKFARRHRAGLLSTAALLLVVLLAAAGVGWAWWERAAQEASRRLERAERLAETDRAVSVALARAGQWASQAEGRPTATSQQAEAALGIWDQADAAVAEADAALRTGAAEEPLRQRVHEARRRLEQGRRQTVQRRTLRLRQERLLHALDGARQQRATWLETTFDHAGAAAQYQAAFAAYGLAVERGGTADLARRIRAEEPAIREALLVALDDWASAAGRAGARSSAAALRELAAAADDDGWRKGYRAASTAGDRATLRNLSVQARKLSLPPSSLVLLAWSLFGAGERDAALALLRWARGRHPTDFWIAMDLGTFLREENEASPVPVDLEERIGCFRVAVALRPDSSAAHNNLGGALADKGQLDDAIAQFRKAIDFNPRNAKAHINLGLALKAKGQLDDAIAEYRKAIDIDPRHVRARVNLGIALKAKGQLDDAIAEYRKAIKLDPRLAPAHYNLGNALQAKGQLDDAIAEYRRAIELDPRDAKAHYNLGNALADKGQLDDAIAAYRKAIDIDPRLAPAHCNLGLALKAKGQLDDAIAEYRKAIELDPRDAHAHNNLGSALQAKGQPDDAIAECRKAIELDPRCSQAHNNLGVALADKGQLDAAMAEYRKAIDLDPRLAPAHYNLGNALKAKGQLDDAIAEYRRAIDIDPRFAPAHVNLGNALQDKGQLDDAIAEHRKAIELDPRNALAHNNLGNALQDKGQLDDAIAEHRKAIELDPRNAQAHVNLGIALKAKGQLDDAIAEYRKAIDFNPRYAQAHNSLGNALKAKGQLDDAIAEYRKAIKLDPRYAQAHNNLGIALKAKGQLDDAIAEYRKAIDFNPKYALAHYNLGLALADKGQLDDAIAQFRKAIELDPRNVPARVNLGIALQAKGQLDDAIAEHRKAIKLNPRNVKSHWALGTTLLRKGRFAEAKTSTEQALKLLARNDPLQPPLLRQLQQCQTLLALKAKLPDVLAGKAQPADQREWLGFLEVCRLQQRHAATATLAAAAFAADARLADDLKAGHRYHAACAAALAAAGQGSDAGPLDATQRSRLRQQALDWLRADLALCRKRLADATPAERQATRKMLQHWQRDTDLASVRDAATLKKLPAEEDQAWRKLWDDVAEMLPRGGDGK